MSTIKYDGANREQAQKEYREDIERRVENALDEWKKDPKDFKDFAQYSGFDEFQDVVVKDDTIYTLLAEPQLEALQRGDVIGVNFFTSQDMFERFTYPDPNTGEKVFDAKALSQALQIAPYHGTYKVNLVAFDIDRSKLEGGELIAAGGICGAQSQLGCGGGEQIMFSAQDSKLLQQKGVIKFNPQKSLIGKGQNHVLSALEAQMINDAIAERNAYCRDNQTLSHDTKKEYSAGFQVLEHAQDNLFDHNGRIKADIALMQETVIKLNKMNYIPDCEEGYNSRVDILKPLVLRFSNHWQELEYVLTKIYAKHAQDLLNQDKSIDIKDLYDNLIHFIKLVERISKVRADMSKKLSLNITARDDFEKYTAREQLNRGEVSTLTKKWQASIQEDKQIANNLLRKHKQEQIAKQLLRKQEQEQKHKQAEQQKNINQNRGRGGFSR